jgi:hypothetical protein
MFRHEQAAIAKKLRGKKLARLTVNIFETGQDQHPLTCSPKLHFADGTVLRFVVNETEHGEYGLELVLDESAKRKRETLRDERRERQP